MTTIHRPRPHTTAPARNGYRAPYAESRSPHYQPRARRVSDGIVASYLHDISARHRRATPTGSVVPADDEEQGRSMHASSAIRTITA
jgi:hypothetical protein